MSKKKNDEKKKTAPKVTSGNPDPSVVAAANSAGQEGELDPQTKAILGISDLLGIDDAALVTRARSKPVTVRDFMESVGELTPDEVRRLQTRLFNAGLYPTNVYRKGVNPVTGVMDVPTINALSQLVKVAVFESAKGRSVDEVLAELSAANEQAIKDMIGGDGGGGSTQVVRLSDPAEVGILADRLGRELLGRRLTDEERRRAVAAVHGAERSSGTAVAQAALSAAKEGRDTVILQTDVNPAAQTEAFIRREFATEVGAHSMAEAYQALIQMFLGSG